MWQKFIRAVMNCFWFDTIIRIVYFCGNFYVRNPALMAEIRQQNFGSLIIYMQMHEYLVFNAKIIPLEKIHRLWRYYAQQSYIIFLFTVIFFQALGTIFQRGIKVKIKFYLETQYINFHSHPLKSCWLLTQ